MLIKKIPFTQIFHDGRIEPPLRQKFILPLLFSGWDGIGFQRCALREKMIFGRFRGRGADAGGKSRRHREIPGLGNPSMCRMPYALAGDQADGSGCARLEEFRGV